MDRVRRDPHRGASRARLSIQIHRGPMQGNLVELYHQGSSHARVTTRRPSRPDMARLDSRILP
jgi:hypothetical protein